MSKLYTSTPKKDGFRMPGEFEPHERIFMAWPQRNDNWRLGAKPAQETFTNIAMEINRFTPVTVLVNEDQFLNARSKLPESIRVIEMSTDDAWLRDSGPAFVKNDLGELRVVHFGFNAWGGLIDGLYFPWDKDAKVGRKIAELEEVSYYDATDFILEGGSFFADGEGTIITTAQCLLSPGRNPQLNQAEIELKLCEYLGAEKVIWLPEGIDPEETNGHVDDVCCFARPGEVVIAWTDDESHPYYDVYKQARAVLEECTDAKGRKLKIHTVPLIAPGHLTEDDIEGIDSSDAIPREVGDEYAPSYMNYLVSNGGVFCPQFGLTSDTAAIAALQEIYPEHSVVGINSYEVILGGGNIHCITQQKPVA